MQEFQNFLIKEQQEDWANNDKDVSVFIRDFLQDTQRDIQEPWFNYSEFIDYLFSKQNDIWDTKYDEVFHDMSRPLSHYFIASSHNT